MFISGEWESWETRRLERGRVLSALPLNSGRCFFVKVGLVQSHELKIDIR